MNAELISPFAEAAVSILESLIGTRPSVGVLGALPRTVTTQQINVICQVSGHAEGLVIYGMSAITADRIASIVTQTQVVTFDKVAAATIVSLSNMFNTAAAPALMQTGRTVQFSPPTILRGANEGAILRAQPAIVIPLTIEGFGNIEVNVSLRECIQKAA